jgi:hypothetical protein
MEDENMNRCATTFMSLAAAALLAANAHAALIDRGNGMIYDNVLDITWLQDAKYAATSDGTDGTMYWDQALRWADELEYSGFTDWRLPSANLIGNSVFSNDGSTDYGYNVTRSEVGHLFYVDLQNDSGVGPVNASFIDGLTGQPKSFLNFEDDPFWYSEGGVYTGWLFDARNGLQYGHEQGDARAYAFAVRDGDVATVPVPSAVWLLSSALIGLAGLARRKSVR